MPRAGRRYGQVRPSSSDFSPIKLFDKSAGAAPGTFFLRRCKCAVAKTTKPGEKHSLCSCLRMAHSRIRLSCPIETNQRVNL
jgi:hypothetical protein